MDLVAELLAGSKTSRLYRALVYDQRIATEIAASQNSREIGGFFQVVATAAPGRTLQDLEAAITNEIDAFVASGPTPAEMERGLAQAESHFIYRLQTVGGFGGKSDQLNAYNVFLGDPDYFDKDLDRYRRMSAQASRPKRAGFSFRTAASRSAWSPRAGPNWRSTGPSRPRCRDDRRSFQASGSGSGADLFLPRHPASRARQRAAGLHGGASRRPCAEHAAAPSGRRRRRSGGSARTRGHHRRSPG